MAFYISERICPEELFQNHVIADLRCSKKERKTPNELLPKRLKIKIIYTSDIL